MVMFYIYIKKQIKQLLFVDAVAIKIIDNIFSKVLYSQNLRRMCCVIMYECRKKIFKMKSPGLRFLLLYLLIVFSKYLPLVDINS